jgi:hypothetical protein
MLNFLFLFIYSVLVLKKAHWGYSSSDFIWLPTPPVLACSLLGRDTMRFIRCLIFSNLIKNVIYRTVCYYLF